MRKRIILFAALFTFAVNVKSQETVTLPTPDKDVPMTLMQALQQRHSVRDFLDKNITDMQLSQILWAACGINRPEKKMITAPSAGNIQDVKVYVTREDGTWLFQPLSNTLKKVTDKDLRETLAGRQVSVAAAPVILMLVSDQSGRDRVDEKMGNIDTGYVSQNICLACTALGLATVPRGTRDKDVLKEALSLNDSQIQIVNHPIGYEK